jgi:hypothetical protein
MDGTPKPRPTRYRDRGEWQRILHDALPEFRCSACGTLDWEALGDDRPGAENLVGVLHFVDWEREVLAGVIGSVASACRNCGKIKLFSEGYLARKASIEDE